MEEPDANDLADLQTFLESTAMGPSGLKLDGSDSGIWGRCEKPYDRVEDLVATVKPGKHDAFSRWCHNKLRRALFGCGLHRFRRPDKVTGEVFYYERKLLRLTNYLSTVLAPLLLVLSITVLWMIRSMKARLALIAAFNLSFSLCVAIFTTAPRSQIFAITCG
jgi:hypothetical protein